MSQQEPMALKGIVEDGSSGHRWRLCITPEQDWCIEFDEDALHPGTSPKPSTTPGEPFPRSVVLLRPDAQLVEFRFTNVEEFLTVGSKPVNGDPENSPLIVTDPTSRGAFC